jgi:hypothetical protein
MNRFSSLLVVLFVVYPLQAEAQLENDLILWANDIPNHNAYCEFPEGYAAKGELFVWVMPELGLDALWFSLDYPEFVVPEDMIINENVVRIFLGDLDSGIEIGTHCIVSDTWVVRQTFWITSGEYEYIDIAPHSNPDIGLGFLYCGHGSGAFAGIGGLFINMPNDTWACLDPLDLVVGNDESSWGAIKSIYNNR